MVGEPVPEIDTRTRLRGPVAVSTQRMPASQAPVQCSDEVDESEGMTQRAGRSSPEGVSARIEG